MAHPFCYKHHQVSRFSVWDCVQNFCFILPVHMFDMEPEKSFCSTICHFIGFPFNGAHYFFVIDNRAHQKFGWVGDWAKAG